MIPYHHQPTVAQQVSRHTVRGDFEHFTTPQYEPAPREYRIVQGPTKGRWTDLQPWQCHCAPSQDEEAAEASYTPGQALREQFGGPSPSYGGPLDFTIHRKRPPKKSRGNVYHRQKPRHQNPPFTPLPSRGQVPYPITHRWLITKPPGATITWPYRFPVPITPGGQVRPLPRGTLPLPGSGAGIIQRLQEGDPWRPSGLHPPEPWYRRMLTAAASFLSVFSQPPGTHPGTGSVSSTPRP